MREFRRQQLVHHDHALKETRFSVQLAALVFHQAKRLKSIVLHGRDLEHLQAHAQENVVDGVELQVVGDPVEPPRQSPVHQKPPTARIRRVVCLIVQGVGYVVFVLFFTNGLGFENHVPHEQVAVVRAAFQELYDVLHPDENVIVPFEHVAHRGAVRVEPLEEVSLFEREVEEAIQEIPLEDISVDVVLVLHELLMVCPLRLIGGFSEEEKGLYPLAVQNLLFAPGFSNDLPAVMLGGHRFNHHEQIYLPRAALRVVEEHGEVSAVSIKHELLEIVLKALEPLLASEVEIGTAVGAGYIPGPGAAALSDFGLLRGVVRFTLSVAFTGFPEAFHPQVQASFVFQGSPRLRSLRGVHASLPLQFKGNPHIDGTSLDHGQRHHSQEKHDTQLLVHPPAISVVHPDKTRIRWVRLTLVGNI